MASTSSSINTTVKINSTAAQLTNAASTVVNTAYICATESIKGAYGAAELGAKLLFTKTKLGFPAVLWMISPVAKIAMGLNLKDPAAQGVVVVNKAFGSAVDILSCFSSPVVNLQSVKDNFQNAKTILIDTGVCTKQVRLERVYFKGDAPIDSKGNLHPSYQNQATLFTDLPRSEQQTLGYVESKVDLSKYKIINFGTVKVEDKARAEAKIIACYELLKVSLGLIADAAALTQKLVSLEAVRLADKTLVRVASVAGVCSQVTRGINLTALGWRLADMTYSIFISDSYEKQMNEGEKAAYAMRYKQVWGEVAKTALTVAITVFAAHFSLAAQGAISLAMIVIDVIMVRYKDDCIEKRIDFIRIEDTGSGSLSLV